jgi:tRNA pseudouridine13 synthase
MQPDGTLTRELGTPALDPLRAYGAPLARGILRAEPEDFVVEENLGFTPSGTGQHILLRVRKRNANTQWVARELAKLCGCHPRDVGYAGLKDRRSIAVQWFTVPGVKLSAEAWREVRQPEFEVLEAAAHSRKLPRGALSGNRFIIRVRNPQLAPSVGLGAFDTRIAEIRSRGVPNYFGSQRFGRDGGNLARIADGLSRLRTPERGFVLSAARSLIFNAVLGTRVAEGSWHRLETGDIANLDGRGSVFPVDAVDDTLTARCEALDIHPTGPLWGRGLPETHGRVQEIEKHVAAAFPTPCALVAEAGMEQERRALRLSVHDLLYDYKPEALTLRFSLARGSFATSVLREIIDTESSGGEESDEA